MQWCACRILLGAAALAVGIVRLEMGAVEAADAVPDAEFKMLVDQDAKNIVTNLNNGKPAKKTADRAIKSSALMIAAYAQGRMGKNPADDAKLATLRDTAIKVAKTGGAKKYADAVAPAKLLAADMAAAGKPDTKNVDLIAATGVDIEELMYQFKKIGVGGLGIEEDIKANAKKLTMKPDLAAALGQRTLVAADLCAVLQPSAGFNAAKPKKDWDQDIKDMKGAATALVGAAKANNTKDVQTAFNKLDASCVHCHDKFKND
jgi:Cytochrome C'